ncbi:MAG: hypothetical protein ABIM85_01710 [candidate division WOR-3 bacterium]
MILKLLLFTYISSFGFQHLFLPYSPYEDIMLKDEPYFIFEKNFFEYKRKNLLDFLERKSYINFNYLKWIAGSKINKISIYYESLKLILTFKFFDYGKFEFYEFPSEEPLLTYNPFGISLGLTKSFFFSKNFPFFISLFYNEEKFLNSNAENFTLNFNLFINILKNPKIEISLNNLGTKPSYSEEYIRIPTYSDVKIINYSKKFDLEVNITYRRGLWGNKNFYNGYHLSLEKDFKNFIKLFIGIGKKDDISNFGAGFELKIKKFLNFVYSYRPSDKFEDINSFGLKINF